jgi:hypothetical protein
MYVHILTLGYLEDAAQIHFVDIDVGRKQFIFTIKPSVIGKIGYAVVQLVEALPPQTERSRVRFPMGSLGSFNDLVLSL